jgi:hypothetical protein
MAVLDRQDMPHADEGLLQPCYVDVVYFDLAVSGLGDGQANRMAEHLVVGRHPDPREGDAGGGEAARDEEVAAVVAAGVVAAYGIWHGGTATER